MTKYTLFLLILIALPFSGTAAQTDTVSITLTETAVLGRGTIQELEWRPDGSLLAVGSSSGIWLFDADFAPISHFELGYVWDIRWDRDGHQLAVSTGDSRVLVLEISADGTSFDTTFAHNYSRVDESVDWIELSWSPDGDRLAATRYWTKQGDVFDLATGDILFSEYPVNLLEWSPTGEYIAAIYYKKPPVGLLSAETGELVRKLPGIYDDSHNVNFLSFIPDGSQLIGSGYTGTHVWDVDAGILLNKPGGWCECGLVTAKLSPDGDRLGYSSWGISSDHTFAGVLDILSPRYSESPQMDGSATDVAWTPDGMFLTVGSKSGKLFHWSLDENMAISYELFNSSVDIVAWSLDGSMIASAAFMERDTPIRVWDMQNVIEEQLTPQFALTQDHVSELRWRFDNRYLLALDDYSPWQATYFMYQHDLIEGGQPRMAVSDHGFSWPIYGWSSDNNRFAYSYEQSRIDIGALIETTDVKSFESYFDWVLPIVWSPNDDRIATLGWHYEADGAIVEIWDSDTGQRLLDVEMAAEKDTHWSARLRWSKDGNTLAVGLSNESNTEYSLYFVDTITGDIRLIHTYALIERYRVPTIEWSAENRLGIVNRDPDHTTLTMFDGDSGDTLYTIDSDYLTGFAWHPDFDFFAISTRDTLDFYNGANGERISSTPFSGRIDDTSWSPDGTRLALFGYDERIHIWDIEIE